MYSSVVEARGRIGTVLATQFDADGKEVKFDIREDELQSEKLQETTELLVAAGYFRARIKGLPAFDKVVGGMVWCISFCDFDVDVDLLYQENLTIGQRISLTEKIVRILPKMKCPFAIEPHQIQGLDFIHIFPVVQWLVRKAIEARQEMGDFVQAFAAYQFDRDNFSIDDLQNAENVKKSALTQDLSNLASPQRLYRRNNPSELIEEASRVQSTILEYSGMGPSSVDSSKKSKADSSAENQDNVGDLMTGMSKINENRVKLSASAIASIVDAEKIQQVARDLASEMPLRQTKQTFDVESTLDSVANLTERKDELIALKLELETDLSRLKSVVDEEKKKFLDLKSLEETVSEQYQSLQNVESATDEKEAELLKSLLIQRDETKKNEQEFKDRCKREATMMQTEIDRLIEHPTAIDNSDEALNKLRHDHSELKKVFDEGRLDLASVNREIAVIQRKLDDVPSRAELNQYQRRFMELYNQIASTHKETKKFYTLFNTLQDVKTYIEKEVNLLNSVCDNYETALTSEQTKLQFVRQLEQTLEGIRQTKVRVEKKFTEEKMKRDNIRENYQEMLDKQRLYYKTVKDFQEECRKNEVLHSKLKDLGAE